jgi:hypothetical protein
MASRLLPLAPPKASPKKAPITPPMVKPHHSGKPLANVAFGQSPCAKCRLWTPQEIDLQPEKS